MQGLGGKTIVMVGGAGRIGGATSVRLGAEGANVVVGDVDLAAADDIASRIEAAGGRAVSATVDVADEASVAALFKTAQEAFGGVDGVHVNAANTSPAVAMQDSNACEVPVELFDTVMRTNALGPLLCVRYAIPLMLQRGGGGIVVTSSCDAFDGQPTRPLYSMSKAAVNALVRHVASRWGKEGVRANAIAPGLVAHDPVTGRPGPGGPEFQESYLARTRSPRLGSGSDIAAMVSFLLSDDGAWVNGQVLSVDGGLLLR